MSLTPGTRLGPYEILAAIGAGGMGEVYKARDTRLDRTVAVKVLSPAIAAAPDARQRFEREARAISQLSHPHVCALYDVGQAPHPDPAAGGPGILQFLVMEFLEGETLAERLRRVRCRSSRRCGTAPPSPTRSTRRTGRAWSIAI